MTRVETTAADGSVQVSFVPVDFSGAPFVSVDPTSLSSFRLPEGDYGLFTQSRNPAGQYLIESNPSLTNTEQFMSSDYLLKILGYDPTEADRRLGAGRYETRLCKNDGTLINNINLIAAVKNPTTYEQALIVGTELLKKSWI